METWAIVTLVLGTSALSSLLTFFITKMQVSHSDARLAKQLARQREVDNRQRRWEVRSEPLLRLRYALAQMAVKLEVLVINTQEQHYRSDITDEERSKELERAVEDLKVYGTSEDFLQTLNLQYDVGLIELVESIENGYRLLFEYALDYKDLKPDDLKFFRKHSRDTKNKISEVQEAINKILEGL